MNNTSPKKLYRIKKGQIVAGVCTGFAEYFQIDVVLIRVVFIALLFAGGSGILLYILLALIIPEEKPTDGDGPTHTASGTTSHTHNVHESTGSHQGASNTHHHDTRTHNPETVEGKAEEIKDNVKEFVSNVQENAQKIAEDVKQRHGDFGNFSSSRNIAALVIVGIGVLALFNSVTGFRLFRWDLFWPFVLIFIGGIILFRRNK